MKLKKTRIIEMHKRGKDSKEIAQKTGANLSYVRRTINDHLLAQRMGLDELPSRRQDEYEVYLPTPVVIADRAAAIRGEWSETTRKQRCAHALPKPVEIQTVSEYRHNGLAVPVIEEDEC